MLESGKGATAGAAVLGGFMAARLTAYVVVGIVAATLIAGLIVGAQRDDTDGPVDIIIHNAKVYTAGPPDEDAETGEAIAIRGNQVLRVGSEREIQRLRKPQTMLIDAKGGAVLPGFTDSHLHLVEGGLALDRVDLSDASSVDDLQQRIRLWAEAHPDAAWVVGSGWRASTFAGTLPTRQMLDALVPDRPAQMLDEAGRVSWVNSRALRLAGITRRSPAAAGIIARDPKTGEASGVLRGDAVALVGRLVPAATRSDRARAVRTAIEQAHRFGITSIQTLDSSTDDLALFAEARRAGDLPLRVYSALGINRVLGDAEVAALDSLATNYPDDPLFKSGAVSIDLDGPIESRRAAMLEPYADGTESAAAAMAPDDFNRLVRLLDARGWQVITSASGDRAVRMALNAYEHAVRSNRVPERGRRHRVEGIAILDPADAPRFGALGVIASMQPGTFEPTPDAIETLLSAVGSGRAASSWPYGTIAGLNGRLAFGSDWPHAPLNPMLALHAAVTRTAATSTAVDSSITSAEPTAWNPSERLALEAAIDAYTSVAAWASFDEQRKGALAKGMLADLVVLSEDVFEAPPSRLASTRVTLTMFDGKIVYRRDGQSTN
jgi:predicted amidohydrolase YtcJ